MGMRQEKERDPRSRGGEGARGGVRDQRVLAYSDLNHHHQIHLGRSPEERAIQRATKCTLSTQPRRNIVCKRKKKGLH